MDAKVRVLSLDGGGMKGLVSALLLRRLENERPGFLEAVDVFAGTSAGGVLALALASATGTDRRAKLDEYIELWSKHNFGSMTPLGFLEAVAGFGPVLSNAAMKAGFTGLLGENVWLDQLPTDVIIPTFQLDNGNVRGTGERTWRPNVFHTFKTFLTVDKPDQEDDDWFTHGTDRVTTLDLAMRTTALPVILPIYQGFLDGAVFANNPSMCALSLLLHHRPSRRAAPPRIARTRDNLGQIYLLSVGTGRTPTYVSGGDQNWGAPQWLMNPDHPFGLLDLFFLAGIEVVDMQARSLLGDEQYRRFDPVLERPIWATTGPTAETMEVLRDTVGDLKLSPPGSPKDPDADDTLDWLKNAGWPEPTR